MGSVWGMDGVQIVTAQQYLSTFLQYAEFGSKLSNEVHIDPQSPGDG